MDKVETSFPDAFSKLFHLYRQDVERDNVKSLRFGQWFYNKYLVNNKDRPSDWNYLFFERDNVVATCKIHDLYIAYQWPIT